MEPLWAWGLKKEQQDDINKLDEACRRFEEIEMKLNRDMLAARPADEKNDILCYDGSKLVAFLGIYAINPDAKEIEITGMVHPDYRRRGLFSKLLEMALIECRARGAERALLIAEKRSQAGMGFIERTQAGYVFSEYRMGSILETIPVFNAKGVTLRKAEKTDYRDLSKLDRICFGIEDISDEEQSNPDEKTFDSTSVAVCDGNFIGKIGLSMEGDRGYIFGFAVLPKYRGKGYGREILSKTLLALKDSKINSACLEVAVENENALNLYKSCGFRVDTVYNYYEIKLFAH